MTTLLIRSMSFVVLGVCCTAATAVAQTSQNDPRLREGLRRYPEADADGDGVLTMREARAFLGARGMTAAEALRPPGGRHGNELVADVADVAYGPHERCRLDLYLPMQVARDMLGWITPDDPPLLLDSPETVAVPTTRSHIVHSVRHARAVRSECAADGVECIVRQDHPEPPRAVDFLLSRLRPAGRQAAEPK